MKKGYKKNLKLAPLVQKISWSNNIIILEKCENNYQIEYYLKLSKRLSLSKRVLQNKIESGEFERILSINKINNFDLTLKEENLQIVEYALKGNSNPLAISEYSFKNLSENLRKNLPGEDKIEEFLKQF